MLHLTESLSKQVNKVVRPVVPIPISYYFPFPLRLQIRALRIAANLRQLVA